MKQRLVCPPAFHRTYGNKQTNKLVFVVEVVKLEKLVVMETPLMHGPKQTCSWRPNALILIPEIALNADKTLSFILVHEL